MRIALFGGTFDPPHRGHIVIARAAARAFHLDQVLFAPTGRQPLKPDPAATSFTDRLALTVAACQDAFLDSALEASLGLADDHPAPQFVVTNIDQPRPGGLPNYTVDTLTELRNRFPSDTLFNLVGADSFLSLPRWHSPARLLELVEWIVVTRPGYPLTADHLAPLHLTPAQRERVHILTDIDEDVSATRLRARLRRSDRCADLLSPSVSRYIAELGLYR